MLPWKAQKVVNLSPDIDYFSKSLPPPPSGHFWERQDNGEWVLFRLPVDETSGLNSMEFTKPSIFEHTVMPTDTLQGICLRYRVSPVTLRRMNMFSGNNIQFKKTLLISIEGGCMIEFQQNTEEVTLQKFRNITQEGVAESRLYLDEHGWNLELALAAWRNDETWIGDAEKEGMIIPPVPVVDFPEEEEEEEEEVDDEHDSALSPAAISIPPAAVVPVSVVFPAFISNSHPNAVSAVGVELSTMESADQTTVPLLA